MNKRHDYRPLIELTAQQRGVLLHKSHTQPRCDHKRYLNDLGGTGTARELDEALAIARCDEAAVREAADLDVQWEQKRLADGRPISREVSQAASVFVQSLLAGEFGLDDSRDGRAAAFLNSPHTVARTTEIFLERILVDRNGKVLNHDEAEQHAVDYLRDYV